MPRQLKRRAPGGATEIQCLARRLVAHCPDGNLGQRFREIGHAVILIAVVEFGVFGQLLVAFVIHVGHRHHAVADNITETGVLEKVAAKRIARRAQRFVATGDPGAAFDEIVSAIKRRCGEVIVNWMDFKTFKRIDRCLGPLPDIADHVIQLAVRKAVDRTGRGKMIEVQIGLCRLIRWHFANARHVIQSIPFILGRQAHADAIAFGFPLTERLGLVVIHFCWPIPRHCDHFGHQTQLPARICA